MDRSNRRIATLMGFALLLTASAAARAEDWPMYGRDLKHSFTNSAALINASIGQEFHHWGSNIRRENRSRVPTIASIDPNVIGSLYKENALDIPSP